MKLFFKYAFIALFLIIGISTIRLYIFGNSLPNFQYKNINNKIVHGTSLPKKKTLFFFFTTNCGSCEIGAQEICNFGKQNPNVNLVFITENQNIEEVKKFIKNNKIYEVTKNIFIDYNRNFREDFGLGISISIPTILYYDENGKYVKEIKDFVELPLI